MSGIPFRRAAISLGSSGDNIIISNAGPQACKVYKLFLSVNGAVNVVVKDGSTQIDGPYILTANGSSMTFFNDGDPHWITQGDFVLNLSTSVNASGQVYYNIG